MRKSLTGLLVAGTFALLSGSTGITLGKEPAPRFILPELSEFWAIVERPLFSPSRRPNDDAPPEEAATPDNGAEADAVPGMLLVGTATDQGTRAVAVLRNPADATEFRVWVGDAVGGWHVKAINPRAIVLVSADTEVTVTLDDPLLPAAPAQP